MSQLQGKVGVLYVLENDAKSHRALSMAQFIPEIYIQYVGLLSEDKIPPWLREVPTCVTLSDRKLHTGTEALELLSSLQSMKTQQTHPQSHPPQQFQPTYPSAGRGQTQPQVHPQQMQQNQQMQQMQQPAYPPQQNQQMQQPAYPPQQMQQNQQMRQPAYPPQQRPQANVAQPSPPSQLDGVLKGSLLPASGTGNYGCSLDMAFAPMEEAQPPEQPMGGKAGKVDQRDIDSYLRIREQQSGKLKSLAQ